jgi:hypothetical protein
MAEQLTKLRPDRDLQCYFLEPSAVAALSQTSPNGFTVSGSWREQFDWAVVEWNRDNVFEHPALRNLPDGDLKGVQLSYQEVRTNCIPMDSTLYPTVEWPYLRIWAETGGVEALYDVPLNDPDLGYATPTSGSCLSATVTFELQGMATGGDYIELAWLEQHFNYLLTGSDTLESAATALAEAINEFGDGTVSAAATAAQITLTYIAAAGANANRIGVYGTVHGAATETWSPSWALFSGGTSPTQWQVSLNFSALQGYIDPDRSRLVSVPTSSVRKMRWTWAADLQPGNFQRSEFCAVVTNWSVTGVNLLYQVAGPGSRRIEDDSTAVTYSPASHWSNAIGNYSGGLIHWTTTPGSSLQCSYTAGTNHALYLGTRYLSTGGQVSVQVDGSAAISINLALPSDDVLVRVPLGQLAGGVQHSVAITNDGAAGAYFYFDFLEIAVPTNELPDFPAIPAITLATDWDTNHSISLAPERTAWLIQKLGFVGRANHYVGALWFYELTRPGQQYASAAITFVGNPEFGQTTSVTLGGTLMQHLNLIGDTAESVATCFALLINAGSNSVWAEANGAVLKLVARAMGTSGNGLSVSATTVNSASNGTPLTAQTSAPALTGGIDGTADPNHNFWRTDLTAIPRINRAARDWSRSFFTALRDYGIDAAASFSMELQNGDDGLATGIAQRYPNGDPAWLTTPALQTNFGPASTAFWQQAHADMAGVMSGAGMVPYLQFGEVQWWYFPGPTATAVTEPGLPLYDAYTTATFESTYRRPMAIITSQYADPGPLAEECAFLPGLVGAFTKAIRDFVRLSFPNARFEVLYPTDVNGTALNQLINFPSGDWTPTNLACLKTENFTYTYERDLNMITQSIQLPGLLGFPPSQSSHLVGISDYTTPWQKEQQLASGSQLESVVLFALDQFCLIGYGLPLPRSVRRARFMGTSLGPR